MDICFAFTIYWTFRKRIHSLSGHTTISIAQLVTVLIMFQHNIIHPKMAKPNANAAGFRAIAPRTLHPTCLHRHQGIATDRPSHRRNVISTRLHPHLHLLCLSVAPWLHDLSVKSVSALSSYGLVGGGWTDRSCTVQALAPPTTTPCAFTRLGGNGEGWG